MKKLSYPDFWYIVVYIEMLIKTDLTIFVEYAFIFSSHF